MRIKFNPPGGPGPPMSGGSLTKEERTEYLDLCKKLTTDPEYWNEETAGKILRFTKTEILHKVDKLFSDKNDEKQEFIGHIEQIFNSANEVKDLNLIGKINIVCYQCIILFTHHALKGKSEEEQEKEFTTPRFCNFLYDLYKEICKKFSSGSSWTWTYKLFVKYIKSESKRQNTILVDLCYIYDDIEFYKNKTLHEYSYKRDDKLFTTLIIALDILTLDEINESLLNRVSYCGLASKREYADGIEFLPIQFLCHDMEHKSFTRQNCIVESENKNNFQRIKDFYEYCKKKVVNNVELYHIEFAIFYIIHEIRCGFQKYSNEEKFVSHFLRKEVTDEEPMKRYMDKNDLETSIPKQYERTEEGIKRFLRDMGSTYIKYMEEWSPQKVPKPEINVHHSLIKELKEINVHDTLIKELKEIVFDDKKVKIGVFGNDPEKNIVNVYFEGIDEYKPNYSIEPVKGNTQYIININKKTIKTVKDNCRARDEDYDKLKEVLDKFEITLSEKSGGYRARRTYKKRRRSSRGSRRRVTPAD